MRRLGTEISFASSLFFRANFCHLPPVLFADSVTRSPLYSIYGETIAGVTIIRAFGASSKFLRDMLRCVDTVSPSKYHVWLLVL
jgi:hypothetical protein